MFFNIYILKSEKNNRFYIGFTPDLLARLEKHNQGKVYWTKRHTPWKLIYYEGYLSKMDALNREKQLKRFANGFTQLKRRISNTIKL
ncbi:GIY-YIG nuclease family protein [Candidatus Wolfebacteria bacterium]|nr:GIY-YIG nuclease family protein [Candidatus Wolfebacteria bacterium]